MLDQVRGYLVEADVMPIWEFNCKCGKSRDVFDHRAEYVDARDIRCDCGKKMKRIPSFGRGLLYFEEGRGRWINNLGPDPVYITSHKEHQAAMSRAGVLEAGSTPPKSLKQTGKLSEKGKWLSMSGKL